MISLTWIYLLIGSILEPCWVMALTKSRGFKIFKWSVVAVILIIASPFFLSLAMRDLSMGTAYAIWTGLGAVFTLLASRLVYKEEIAPVRLVFVALIIGGVISLELVGA